MSNKTLVIYSSKTGFTKRYAEWICEELNCSAVAYEKRKTIRFEDYGTVIFGGGIYAGRIRGLKWFKTKLPELTGKTKVVFATGTTPSEAPDVQKTLRQNFTDAEWEQVQTFYMQSGLCYEKMGLIDRLLMAMLKKMLKKKPDGGEAYEMVRQSCDHSAKEHVLPLVACCRDKAD